jgi:glutathione S-transferase
MIKLYGFGEGFGVIDPSPFVVKVDLFLRLAELPFESINDFSNIKKSPKNKMPFIEDKGLKVGDSAFILKYLTQTYDVQLDTFLTAEQKAQSTLMTQALDESLYWCLVYSRWIKEDTWPLINDAFFGEMPVPLKWFLPNIIRKDVKKTLHRQGFGRHSETELLAIADQQFSALSTLLGDKDYFFGEQACSFDAIAYAALCEFISMNFDNSFNAKARSHKNLVDYCQRIEQQFYQ